MIKTDKPHSVFSFEADKDYIMARLVNFAGSAFSSRAGYYAQQALEKYLKAFLVQESKQYPKSHDLFELAKYCLEFNDNFSNKEFLDSMKIFNDFIDLGRYGGEASYDPHAKTTKNFETAGVVVWFESNIRILDALVFNIRSKLDFAKIRFADSLQAIIEGDKKNYFVGTWKLPIKLRDILILGNNYFK